MKNKSTKILYTYTARRSFVNNDLAALSKHFSVKTYHFKTDPKSLTPMSFLLQALYLLVFGWRYNAFMIFFAGYHSMLPAVFAKLTGKKCIIFLGGTDCFNYPSFRYGNFTKPIYGKATCISAHNASLLVPVSENLIYSKSDYYKEDSTIQGIYHWCRPLKTNHHVIHLEYNPGIFFKQDVERNDYSFITVAFGLEGTSFIRKGIDKILMLAAYFPEMGFTILGCAEKDFPATAPKNVSLIPPVPYDQLPVYYSRHRFYLQLSIAEGFPSAICEAMLCECIPIGSDVAAIPAIVSKFGFIVKERNDAAIIDVVNTAINYNDKDTMGRQARNHIISNFGPGSREKELAALL